MPSIRGFDDCQLLLAILVDKFLDAATEVDVDCLADAEQAMIIGVMEHIEEAGIHSGDSDCSLPPYSLKPDIIAELKLADAHEVGQSSWRFAA